jgi:hypothetical protein
MWEVLLILGLVQFPSVRDAFGILKPSATDLGIVLGFGVFVFVSMEVIKAILRRKMSLRRKVLALSSKPSFRF